MTNAGGQGDRPRKIVLVSTVVYPEVVRSIAATGTKDVLVLHDKHLAMDEAYELAVPERLSAISLPGHMAKTWLNGAVPITKLVRADA